MAVTVKKDKNGHWRDQANGLHYPPLGADGRQHQALAALVAGDQWIDDQGRTWTVAEVVKNADGTASVRSTLQGALV